MSVPTEFDFAIIKMGDGAGSEVFSAICGMQDVRINNTASTSDRFVRDCAKPGEVPKRYTQTNGIQWDITGSGLSNATQVATLMAAIGKKKNYKVECYDDDGTDTGALIGTYAGSLTLTANNINLTREGQATAEVTLASNGTITYTAAS